MNKQIHKQILKRIGELSLLFFLSGCFSEPPTTSVFQQGYTQSTAQAAAISADGRFSVVADDKEVCVWSNADKSKLYPCIDGQAAEYVELVGITANNRYFYTSNRVSVSLYNLRNAQLKKVWLTDTKIINDIAVSADGNVLVLGYRTGHSEVINMTANSSVIYPIHALDINRVSVSANGELAFSGSSDKFAKLWRTDTGEIITSHKHRSRVNFVDIKHDAKQGVTLDAINQRYLMSFVGKNKDEATIEAELNTRVKFIEFNDSKFSNSKPQLLTASPRQKIQLWHTQTGELLQEWQSFKDQNKKRASVLAVGFYNNRINAITSDGVYEEFVIKTK